MFLFYLGLMWSSFGLLKFMAVYGHILIMLMMLEMMALGLFLSLLGVVGESWGLYVLLFICFTVCEGALGLVVLVGLSRTHSGDFLGLVNLK
uniref:NADH dehydrogenase subunit 4L n=1 Tax=Neelus murinus TaxID=1348065 RepID=A0A6B9IP07_9HEXA|nr:NADH dehydrogenase subunit 4L [Neelus murinus]